MSALPTRRRVLRILASTSLLAASRAHAHGRSEWRGSALGAEISISFDSDGRTSREEAVARIMSEIERLEAIFSLQDARSELSRLNADGRLDDPSPDMLHVLAVGGRIHRSTRGRFDPTVQSLWKFYVDWYAQGRARAQPPESELRRLDASIGFDAIRIGPDAISMPPGYALTLNGIAQGHITDRGVAILRDLGFGRVLADLGEIGAIGAIGGQAPDESWKVRLPDGATAALRDGALATSAGSATPLADNGDHHLFDPVARRPARIWDWLSIGHPSATIADGLSTGLYCLTPPDCGQALRAFPGARLWGRTQSGETVGIGG